MGHKRNGQRSKKQRVRSGSQDVDSSSSSSESRERDRRDRVRDRARDRRQSSPKPASKRASVTPLRTEPAASAGAAASTGVGPRPAAPAAAADSIEGLQRYLEGQFGHMDTRTTELKNSLERRLDQQDTRIAEIDRKVAGNSEELSEAMRRLCIVEAAAAEWQSKATDLQKRVETAEVAPPVSRDRRLFFREPDPTKIVVNAQVLMGKAQIQKAVSDLAVEAGQPADICTVLGQRDLAKRFVVGFRGTSRIAAGQADVFLDSLKHGDGTWKTCHAPDPKGTDTVIFVSPDKSPAESRKEILTKKLRGILEQMGHQQVTEFKREGEVYLELVPVAKVVVEGPKDASILWCPAGSAHFKLDKSKILEQFQLLGSSARGSIEWSRS